MLKLKFLAVLLILCVVSKVFGQHIEVTIKRIYISIDTIPFTIAIYSKDSLNFPIKTEITEDNEEFTFIQDRLEIYEKGIYKPVIFRGYIDYLPAYILMKTKKYKHFIYEREMGGLNSLVKKQNSYRIRFKIHFDKFNRGVNKQTTKWYYFKIL